MRVYSVLFLPHTGGQRVRLFSFLFGGAFTVLTAVGKLSGKFDVPGYATTISLVSLFGGLNSLGLGIIGEYCWRIFDNVRGRPLAVVDSFDIVERK